MTGPEWQTLRIVHGRDQRHRLTPVVVGLVARGNAAEIAVRLGEDGPPVRLGYAEAAAMVVHLRAVIDERHQLGP